MLKKNKMKLYNWRIITFSVFCCSALLLTRKHFKCVLSLLTNMSPVPWLASHQSHLISPSEKQTSGEIKIIVNQPLFSDEGHTVQKSQKSDLLKPATGGRVKKAGDCVKLWLAGIYFLVHADFVAWKLWIWQQFNFLACQLWQLLLYFIVTVCLAKWHSTLYLYIFACFSLYCCYMLTNSFKTLFFASIIIEILSRITLFLCQILSP